MIKFASSVYNMGEFGEEIMLESQTSLIKSAYKSAASIKEERKDKTTLLLTYHLHCLDNVYSAFVASKPKALYFCR